MWNYPLARRSQIAEMGVLNDFSEALAQSLTRQRARRVASARAQAALSLRLQQRFLANISHELRTPLNAVARTRLHPFAPTPCTPDVNIITRTRTALRHRRRLATHSFSRVRPIFSADCVQHARLGAGSVRGYPGVPGCVPHRRECASRDHLPGKKREKPLGEALEEALYSDHRVDISFVTQVLEFSKLSRAGDGGSAAAAAPLAADPFTLMDVASQLVDVAGARAAAGGVELMVVVSPALVGVVLLGDSFRLRQALTNLADNACKVRESADIRPEKHCLRTPEAGVVD